VKSEEETERETTMRGKKGEACNGEKDGREKKAATERGARKRAELVERGRKTGLVVSTRQDINFPLTICH